jgi:hypothetical protein
VLGDRRRAQRLVAALSPLGFEQKERLEVVLDRTGDLLHQTLLI